MDSLTPSCFRSATPREVFPTGSLELPCCGGRGACDQSQVSTRDSERCAIDPHACSGSIGHIDAYTMTDAPARWKTASGIAKSYSHNLLLRAANVILKERRRLLLMVRHERTPPGADRALIDLRQFSFPLRLKATHTQT